MSNRRSDKNEDSIEKIYQKKTQLEHILLRPDTYIGSIEHYQQSLWVYDSQQDRIVYKQVNYVPGLYKIFDEIIVNAADNYQRDKTMTMIKIEINPDQNKISVWNNGKGIPVAIHKEHNIYVPEMIFGHLLTSSNYNDDQKKVTGGRNGYGAKLANIFSSKFIVETADSKHKLYFKQTYKNNMSVRGDPEITPNPKGEEYTCITFYPDLRKFNMTHLDEDIVSIMTKRVYDLAGVTPATVKVKLNGKNIEVKNFLSYVDLYLQTEEHKELPKIVEKTNSDRWEVVASLSDGQFQQVSFVNSICTIKGGTHVNHIADQIAERIMAVLKKKHKDINVKTHQIKSNLWIFVNSLIENPAFDSQTKETLTTKPNNFGSTCELSEKFMKEILASGIIDSIVTVAKAKEEAKLAKTLGPGKKKQKLIGIPKLEDANLAGTKHAADCTIILTEGDSAKALAVAGIDVVGRDKFGVFPLRGKFLNVREASNKQIMENQEIQNLIKILGIKVGMKYEDVKTLRYGSVMIMTDQDHDGSHIKGLLINFFNHFWPTLFTMNGFLKEFITPIIKATKGNETKTFFTIPEYEQWAHGKNLKSWKVKYYKGLGTSTSKEAKEYFTALDQHQIEFEYQDQEDSEAIDLAFSKKLADKRKEWLTSYNTNLYVDHSNKYLRYKDFVNKELILFSVADCSRSIPSLCDGLKPGQRKVLFACFKRKLRQELKVAQLAGYVAENSAYHHGEVSLSMTIVTMAQNFVGSNNINTLLPIGQFGTRNQGGKEAASPRYLFTCLNKVTRTLYHEDDDALLNYLEEEGQSIEPDYYLPILPMSLVNGAEGIGTGWSTFIPAHNPRDIVANLKRMLRGEPYQQMHPWYKGFQGQIIAQPGQRNYIVTGLYNVLSDDELEITELPVGKWTRDYKNFLEELVQKEEIEEIREYHQENRVHFVLKVPKLQEMVQKNEIEKKFKLSTTISTNNYVLFNYEGVIRRYSSEEEILQEFFSLRKVLYEKRKEFMLAKLKKEFETLSNKVRFILGVINEEIRINKVKRKDVIMKLKSMGFKTMTELESILGQRQRVTVVQSIPADGEDEVHSVEEEKLEEGEVPAKEYDYLLSMPLWSVTEEKVIDLQRQMNERKQAFDELYATPINTIWCRDLDHFLEVLDEYEKKEEEDRLSHGNVSNQGKRKGKGATKKPTNGSARKDKKPKPATKPTKVEEKKTQQAKLAFGNNKNTQKENASQQPQVQDISDLPLRERLLRQQQNNVAHFPTQSVMGELSQSEKNALANGNRKRVASPVDSEKSGRNQQRRRVVADNDEDDVQQIQTMAVQRRARGAQQKKYAIESDSSEEEMSDDDSDFEGMGADDDSI